MTKRQKTSSPRLPRPTPAETQQPPKQPISLRVDQDVLDWFRAAGPGYLTRMNDVLRTYMATRRVSG